MAHGFRGVGVLGFWGLGFRVDVMQSPFKGALGVCVCIYIYIGLRILITSPLTFNMPLSYEVPYGE